MSTTYTHTRVSLVDSYGNIEVLYPQNTASDVMVARTSQSVIPVTVSNAQEAILDLYTALANASMDLSAIVAPDFSPTSTYAVGDYVIYDDVHYKCTTAVSTPGSWSIVGPSFTAVPLSNEVKALRSAVAVLQNGTVLQVNPATVPTTNGAIWITT